MTSHFGTLFICPQTQLNLSSYREQYAIVLAMRPQYYNDIRWSPRIQPISGSYPRKLGKSRNLQENISGLEPILTSENIASYKLRMQLISPKFKQVASLDQGVMLHKFESKLEKLLIFEIRQDQIFSSDLNWSWELNVTPYMEVQSASHKGWFPRTTQA